MAAFGRFEKDVMRPAACRQMSRSVSAAMLLTLRDQSRAPDAKERPATECVPVLWVRLLSAWRH